MSIDRLTHPAVVEVLVDRQRQLQEKYYSASEELQTDYFRTIFSLFGLRNEGDSISPNVLATKIPRVIGSDFRGLLSGSERPGDDAILQKMFEKITLANEPVHILELGSGASYPRPLTVDYGTPWMSRRLQHAFPEKVSLIATDITPESIETPQAIQFAYFYVSPDGKLHYSPFGTSKLDQIEWIQAYVDTIPISELHEEDGQHKFSPISPDVVGRLNEIYREIFPHAYVTPPAVHIQRESSFDPTREGQSYIRPLVDKELELLLSGLHLQGGIDATNLSSSIEELSQDIIFARHIGPYITHQTLEDWQQFLRPGGEIILSGDLSLS